MAEFGAVSEAPGSAVAASACGGFIASGLGDDGGDQGRKQINMSAEKGKQCDASNEVCGPGFF